MSAREFVAGGIPVEALDNHVGILGKAGAGKTYTSRLVIEWLLDQGRRVCIIDPTGVHWGVRLHEDRTGPAHDVAIIGGDHGDIEINPDGGEILGQTIGQRQGAVIVDVSMLTVGQRTRWFADFADALFRANREPLHLVIDEAHLFVPQGRVPNPQSAKMLNAGNHLVSGGRSRGLRVMLLSQRPAKVHKDALTQIETLVAMRMLAPQDRKAVREWIQDTADPELGRRILDELPKMPTGRGYVWAPEQDYLELVEFPRIRTFDSMAAPKPGERVAELPHLNAATVGELEEALGYVSPITNAGPRRRGNGKGSQASRKPTPDSQPPADQRIRELEDQVARANATAVRLREAFGAVEADLERIKRDCVNMARELERQIVEAFDSVEIPDLAEIDQGSAPRYTDIRDIPPQTAPMGARDDDPLVAMARRVWPARLTWSQLCALVGRKARGGHFNRVRKELLASGVVRMREGGRVELTDPPDLGDAIPAAVLEDSLPEPARKMFREIRRHGLLTIEELGEALDLAPRGGHWNNGIRTLRRNELVLERDGRLLVNPELESPR